MATEGGQSSELRQIARDDPETIESLAAKADDELAAWLRRVLEEEGDGSR